MSTRLTRLLGCTHPVISAPMAFAAGGRLAAAVSGAGGLGLIGGGYGEADWVRREFDAAGNAAVGCGFITWNLERAVLEAALDRAPRAIMLSFGDPAPWSQAIHDAGAILIAQVQTLEHAKSAVDAGAGIIVAQGAEAGGHGRRRATMTLVPEVADMLAQRAPDVVPVAAGGIADGRGLAAALMLGAEGVLVGSRLWASEEALVHPDMHAAAVAADGDATIRTSVMDVARRLDWPEGYTARVLRNAYTDRWHDDLEGLRQVAERESARYAKAWAEGDIDVANTFVGEVAGLIRSIEPAAAIVEGIVAEAEARLARDWSGDD
ncbi:nitronate monooxygenase [Roseovarius sp. SCSIO 43702]|nr:nitronate monooxygenase [Roseovarius sp. SCSIO 43702]